MTAGIDPAANADVVADAAAQAAAGGATMLFTPEMTNLIDQDRERSADRVVDEHVDPVLDRARSAARQHGLWIHLGSIAVRKGDRRANRGLLIDPNGDVRARYDKIHLFDADMPTGERWRESSTYRRGEEAVAAHVPGAVMGMSICYDLRFPDLYRGLSDAGATIIAVPAAFTVPTGEAHWHVLLRARAIESAVFVVAAAQAGSHQDGRRTYGHSLVIDPWGTVLLDMDEAPGVGFAEIDLAKIASVRARMPVLEHRRPIGSVRTFD